MAHTPHLSALHVEKRRSHATITLTSGEAVAGCFFVSHSSAHLPGPERIGELLNGADGLFPFEVHGGGAPRTVLLNRAQILTVSLADNEAREAPGYDVATPYLVTVGLVRGPQLMGTIRVYGPDGHNRLSDWARDSARFRYVEGDRGTLLVNMNHVIDVSEAPQ
jgi:hypothetical protein